MHIIMLQILFINVGFSYLGLDSNIENISMEIYMTISLILCYRITRSKEPGQYKDGDMSILLNILF